MQLGKLEQSKQLISQASQALAKEVQNRKKDEDSTFVQAFSKLCRAILAELLKQSVCDEWSPYSCTVDLSYFMDVRHCCYHIESIASSNDIVVELGYDDSLDVFKEVYRHFQKMEHFDAFSEQQFGKYIYPFSWFAKLPTRGGAAIEFLS